MAKNTWKYATLTADQRLREIENGNTDVYNSEVSNLNNLKTARESAGLDTVEVDTQLQSVEDAYNALSPIQKAQLNSLYDVEREDLRKKYSYEEALNIVKQRYENRKNAKKLAEQALEEAEKNLATLDEYYVNKGFSTESGSYIKERQRMKDELEKLFSEIESKYSVTLSKEHKDAAARIFA